MDEIDEENVDKLRNICENKFVGREISCEKEYENIKIFRVQGCNSNGFNIGIKGGDFAEHCSAMFNHQIDVSCLSETNLDSLNYNVKEILEDCAGK